jgi:hypothetical protein
MPFRGNYAFLLPVCAEPVHSEYGVFQVDVPVVVNPSVDVKGSRNMKRGISISAVRGRGRGETDAP